MKNILQIGIIIIIILLLVWLYILVAREPQKIITSFEECAEAGYPILESYPEQCRTPDGKMFIREIDEDEISFDIIGYIESKKDFIFVNEPQLFAEIRSPLIVTGEARGTWYFEADFPVRLEDANGNVIVRSFATAQLDSSDPESTWMTKDFVPFKAELEFSLPSTETGVLILEKDNPSGLPENDDELRIPIRFDGNDKNDKTELQTEELFQQ